MAIRDTSRKPFLNDSNENIFLGIDSPFHISDSQEGMFAGTTDTISTIKNNIISLLNIERGERLMHPDMGIEWSEILFEPMTDSLISAIENKIVATLDRWLPFVEILNLKIEEVSVENYLNDDYTSNTLKVIIDFNIKNQPNSLNSVETIIGE